MTTYRERREARAERLREWAAKRDADVAAAYKEREHYAGDIAFWTQPGRIPQRDRLFAKMDRARESAGKANDMTRRANGIERQLDRSIYDDDPDACERLEDRIAELEAERDDWKMRNTAYRAEHKAELAAMTPYARSQAVPCPSYHMTNLGANINRLRKRLEYLRRRPVDAEPRGRWLFTKYAGTCDTCGTTIDKGALACYRRASRGLRCESCEKGDTE